MGMSTQPPPGRFGDDEWEEWYEMTPLERWKETQKLWDFYLQMGGSLDAEPDSQSPFYFGDAPGSPPAHRRPGLRVVRRGGV